MAKYEKVKLIARARQMGLPVNGVWSPHQLIAAISVAKQKKPTRQHAVMGRR